MDSKVVIWNEVKSWIKTILIAAVVVFVLHQFVFNLSAVEGSSMEPTLSEREWLFINRAAYILGSPSHGDIVILKTPRQSHAGKNNYLVKRVIAVPGDRIEIKERRIYLNDEVLSENYVDTSIVDANVAARTVPQGHYFVMGDNRHPGGSWDSRDFGAVPTEWIKGRADFIVWPVKDWGRL